MPSSPVIDVHAHYIPPPAYDDLDKRPPDTPYWRGDMSDLDVRLEDMDRMGVDIQMLSPWQGFFSRNAAVASRFNDLVAAAVARHPGRFLGIATVPMGEPETVEAELTRAVRELDMRGVIAGTNIHGKMLDEPQFESLFATAESLDVPVFLHPAYPLGSDRLDHEFALDNLIGFLTDTATAAAHLTFSGLMDRHPNLIVYLSHGGGSMPALRGRWRHGYDCGRVTAELRHPPLDILGRFWMDSLTHSDDVLADLTDWPGSSQIMLGTDYPYDMGDLDAPSTIRGNPGLSDTARQAILSDNAARLFRVT